MTATPLRLSDEAARASGLGSDRIEQLAQVARAAAEKGGQTPSQPGGSLGAGGY